MRSLAVYASGTGLKKRFAKKAARGQTGRGKYPRPSQSVYRGELKFVAQDLIQHPLGSQSVYMGELKYLRITVKSVAPYLAIRIQGRVEISEWQGSMERTHVSQSVYTGALKLMIKII